MAEEKQKRIVATHEEAVEAGYLGWVPDETSNEDYTVAGVTKAQPKKAEPAKADPKKTTG